MKKAFTASLLITLLAITATAQITLPQDANKKASVSEDIGITLLR
jgi:hypothetical protein